MTHYSCINKEGCNGHGSCGFLALSERHVLNIRACCDMKPKDMRFMDDDTKQIYGITDDWSEW